MQFSQFCSFCLSYHVKKISQIGCKRTNQFPTVLTTDPSLRLRDIQRWFRNVSVLIQRSLPENFWSALIQLSAAPKTKFSRAKNQRTLIVAETSTQTTETNW